MTRRSTLTTDAQTAVTATTIIATGLHPALTNLETALAGWPTSTPGAAPPTPAPPTPCRDPDCTNIRPCPRHDTEGNELSHLHTSNDRDHELSHLPAPNTTTVETTAAQTDHARRDRDALAAYIRQIALISTKAANIVTRWAHPGLTPNQIRDRLTAIDAAIWCKNCSRYGRKEPRRGDGSTNCDFCARFLRDYHQDCPEEVWRARDARGGTIDSIAIQRILKRIRTERAAAKAKAQADAKAKRSSAEPQRTATLPNQLSSSSVADGSGP